MQSVVPNLPVGPYLVNITGTTFVNDVFLDVAVTANGKPVPDGTTVTFDAAPPKTGDSTPVAATPIHLTAVTEAGHATLVPEIAGEGKWDVTLVVAGAAGSATTTALSVGIKPHSPQASLSYRLLQIAIPIMTVVLLLAFFRLRHIELERWPTSAET
jgi:hypothetical protein